jgi:uncharacterized iron-regulated membrane protein
MERKSGMARTLHRLIGITMTIPLLVWIVTGILFQVKYRYSEAYEPIGLKTPSVWSEAHVSPSELVNSGKMDAGAKLELFTHPSKVPAYAGVHSGMPVAVNAGTGEYIPEATEEEMKHWADDAVELSHNAARYGAIIKRSDGKRLSALTGVQDPAMVFEYSEGKTVTVDRITGEMSQTGKINDWIDWTYQLHYLQWTPWRAINIALMIIAVPLTFALALSGLWLAFGPRGGYSGRRPNSFY